MPNKIKSLSKGLKVYKSIVDYGRPILAKTLCESLNIDKSTMSRLLQTLKDEGFISYLENSNEIIANSIADKTNQSTKIELLINKTNILLEDIAKTTGECAYIGVFDDYKVLYLNQIDFSSRTIKTRNNIGVHSQLHTNALGKSILAFGNYDLEKIKLKQYTSTTITNIKKLEEELEEVRNRGFSIDNKEYQDGMCCVAVPLFNKENILIAAVGISGSSKRLDFNKILEIGNTISNLVPKYEIVY
ncbi:MAG: IclR family transcriptional regulator C-terminal domain-containing protein [Halarcobacter sp.]